jgi:hypothetical protein
VDVAILVLACLVSLGLCILGTAMLTKTGEIYKYRWIDAIIDFWVYVSLAGTIILLVLTR